MAVRGNEPFAYLSIANGKVEYEIIGALAREIWDKLQGRTAILRGRLLGAQRLEVSAIIAVE